MKTFLLGLAAVLLGSGAVFAKVLHVSDNAVMLIAAGAIVIGIMTIGSGLKTLNKTRRVKKRALQAGYRDGEGVKFN